MVTKREWPDHLNMAGIGLCMYGGALGILIGWNIYRFKKNGLFPERSMTLKEGEALVGVIERKRGRYVFIGDDLERYQESLTPQEIKLLRQEFYKDYE